MSKRTNRLYFILVCIIILLFTFFAQKGKKSEVLPTTTQTATVSETVSETEYQATETTLSPFYDETTEEPFSEAIITESTTKEEIAQTTSTAAQSPVTEVTTLLMAESETEAVTEKAEDSCSLSITCATILDNISELAEEKRILIPDNGVILPETDVTISEGESVFDVLNRTVKEKGIHMEYSYTPVYDTVYVEGIANIYEFDCGELSGWTYHVNGISPNVGMSAVKVKPGDKIELLYTCDLGRDVGNVFE